MIYFRDYEWGCFLRWSSKCYLGSGFASLLPFNPADGYTATCVENVFEIAESNLRRIITWAIIMHREMGPPSSLICQQGWEWLRNMWWRPVGITKSSNLYYISPFLTSIDYDAWVWSKYNYNSLRHASKLYGFNFKNVNVKHFIIHKHQCALTDIFGSFFFGSTTSTGKELWHTRWISYFFKMCISCVPLSFWAPRSQAAIEIAEQWARLSVDSALQAPNWWLVGAFRKQENTLGGICRSPPSLSLRFPPLKWWKGRLSGDAPRCSAWGIRGAPTRFPSSLDSSPGPQWHLQRQQFASEEWKYPAVPPSLSRSPLLLCQMSARSCSLRLWRGP